MVRIDLKNVIFENKEISEDVVCTNHSRAEDSRKSFMSHSTMYGANIYLRLDNWCLNIRTLPNHQSLKISRRRMIKWGKRVPYLYIKPKAP